VKEYYFYLDSTPTHSYMKYLYKYPQSAYPYDELVSTNRTRSRHEMEYELIDTGVFDDDRYFDVFVEYAKASAEDILVRITVHNRGPEAAVLHVLPTVWFRNVWSWSAEAQRPQLRQQGNGAIATSHPILGDRFLYADGDPSFLFTENETNTARVFGKPNATPYVKDSINDYLLHARAEAVNPQKQGTKAAAHYTLNVPARSSQVIRLRLSDTPPAATWARQSQAGPFGNAFDALFNAREQEADQFYQALIPTSLNADQANVMRQALAGMMWSKQFYNYDVDAWLKERGADPFKPSRRARRNEHWHHMQNSDVISMPDKWEYPWYAAWDLAFHVLALSLVDRDFGREQLDLMLRENYLHPNGQMPAYEWNFGDVNPPVHAWATNFLYRLDSRHDEAEIDWLEGAFNKLSLNFTWWVNRKDPSGKNAFEGGFLGLDNIGVFDRSAPLPTGGHLEQADGTAWMAFFCLSMLEMGGQLALHRPSAGWMALKFASHFMWIASAMMRVGEDTGMWDEQDGFFYDVLRFPDGTAQRLKVRSMVGLLPLCAVAVVDGEVSPRFPELRASFRKFLLSRPELTQFIHDPLKPGHCDRRLCAILNETNLRRVLRTMLDESEFLSPYGIRALSKYHADHPYKVSVAAETYEVGYLPAESDTGMFGGNSNWRGPIWIPVNALIVRALLHYFQYYGKDFQIECPTGSGRMMNLYEVAEEISRRLASIFLRDEEGRRPVYGGTRRFQEDPHWRDLVLFYEYFHGDNGAGLGASHQTGWTGIIARLMHLFGSCTADRILELGREVAAAQPADSPPHARTPSAA
jgi:hypothetical protein